MLDCCSSLGLRFDVTDVTAYDNLEVRFSVMNTIYIIFIQNILIVIVVHIVEVNNLEY